MEGLLSTGPTPSSFKKIKRFFSICLSPDGVGSTNQPTTIRIQSQVWHCSPVTCSWRERICGVGASYLSYVLWPHELWGCGWLGERRNTASSYGVARQQGGWGGGGGVAQHSSPGRLGGRRWVRAPGRWETVAHPGGHNGPGHLQVEKEAAWQLHHSARHQDRHWSP